MPKQLVEAWNKSLTSLTAVHLISKKIQICVDGLNRQEGKLTLTPQCSRSQLTIDQPRCQRPYPLHQPCLDSRGDFALFRIPEVIPAGCPTSPGGQQDPSQEFPWLDSRPRIYCSRRRRLYVPVASFLSCFHGHNLLFECIGRRGSWYSTVVEMPQKRERCQELYASFPVVMNTPSMLTLFLLFLIVDDARKDFQSTLRMAQFGLGVLFSHQTLKAPCSWLEDGDGAEVLKSLGIDISQLKNEEYSEKFALESLASLSGAYQHFEKLREDIRRQAGLRECMEATMPSSTPNGNGDPMDCQEDCG